MKKQRHSTLISASNLASLSDAFSDWLDEHPGDKILHVIPMAWHGDTTQILIVWEGIA